ncbi:dihydrofolate reductase family protein [Amycolatopsis magusensis]|uniref:dihydrofolate reductase family protein n=1 Tax=Amycolatopsis magusensis TaxID=882444 RepID=UPI0024A8BE8C|nr:dihydrofolate reductase family protein [Amycolatopsis magusensis]MDI5977870.1 dihydrofolate reductase family protein [Amycolatopsis magusensis]
MTVSIQEDTMRKLIVTNLVSLDGFVAGPGGDPTPLPMGGFFDEYNHERQRSAEALVLGRTTYQMLRGYWPAIAEDPSRSPDVLANPASAPMHQDIARRNERLRKLVVSDTLTEQDTTPWTATTTIVARSAAREAVAALKAEGGGDVVVFGSRTVWNHLLTAGLVDEVHLMVGPVALGAGVPAFDAGTPPLRLLDTRRRDGSDNVVLRYEVLRGRPQ